ncbi:phage head-tail adapter protein [Actinoplanes sp. NPDC026670]|uniref:phage head-tail adapter protein n=1 Tax=Actinoplanes sp. NPDC026670 TaxID=3154700 RepID=UPI003400771C
MSWQRRRGDTAKVWPTTKKTDGRGNDIYVVDMEAPPHLVRAVFIPQRSARAEVPGQQQINVVRMLVAADLKGVDLWSRVEWRGVFWDVVTPPSLHVGTRHTRHWSIDLRERP